MIDFENVHCSNGGGYLRDFAKLCCSLFAAGNFPVPGAVSGLWKNSRNSHRSQKPTVQCSLSQHALRISFSMYIFMMPSSDGNIFRVTGPLCGEFIGHDEFPSQRPVTRSFDVFFDLRLNERLNKQSRRRRCREKFKQAFLSPNSFRTWSANSEASPMTHISTYDYGTTLTEEPLLQLRPFHSCSSLTDDRWFWIIMPVLSLLLMLISTWRSLRRMNSPQLQKGFFGKAGSIIKSPRSGVTPCFQFVSAAAFATASATPALAFALDIKTVCAKS